MSNAYETEQMRQWIGHTAVDSNGEKVGKIHDVYEDDMSSGPEWLAISTGWFGTKMSFAPVAGSRADGDTLILPWTKDQIKNSPAFDTNDDVVEEGHHLYSHYGMDYGDDGDDGDDTDDIGSRTTSRDDAMTRSEEEVAIDKRRTETGRVRLKKWVETENVHVTVPVRREVARLVGEPTTDANRNSALDGPRFGTTSTTESDGDSDQTSESRRS